MEVSKNKTVDLLMNDLLHRYSCKRKNIYSVIYWSAMMQHDVNKGYVVFSRILKSSSLLCCLAKQKS